MVRGWCIRSRAPRLWIAARGDLSTTPAAHLSREDARRVVTAWVATGAMDAFERRALAEALRPTRRDPRDLRALDALLRDGSLVAWREDAPQARGGGAVAESSPDAPMPDAPRPVEQDTWISIELINEADEPVRGVAWRVVLPDRSVREGTLADSGVAYLRGVPAGECRVSFTALDGEAWARVGAGAPYIARGDEGETVAVRQGDTTEFLAYGRGLFWETVWDHPNNAALRAKGRRPNVLLPGDGLFLPARVVREEGCATTRHHRFRRRGVPTTLELRCLDVDGRPYANLPYQLTAGSFERRGQLDAGGWLRCWLPLEVRRIRLLIGEDGEYERYDLLVGHLDPIEEPSGVCDRLRNLGYYSGPSVTDEDPRLADAIRWFRKDAGLPEGESVDDALRAALNGGRRG